MDTTYTYTTAPAMTYKITGRSPEDWRFWANITIGEWPCGGSIDVQSNCGEYACSWESIGPMPFRQFLCSLSMDSFMEKTRSSRGWKEYDAEATTLEIRKDIIEGRLHGLITKGDARNMWDAMEGEKEPPRPDIDDWSDCIHYLLYRGNMMDFPYIERSKNECKNFWDIVWPCVCEIWRNEMVEPQLPYSNGIKVDYVERATYTVTVPLVNFPFPPGIEVVYRSCKSEKWEKGVFLIKTSIEGYQIRTMKLYYNKESRALRICSEKIARCTECHPYNSHKHLFGTYYPAVTPACMKCGMAQPDCRCNA